MSATVMIVDDAVFMRNILRAIIKDKGYSVVAEAASGIEGRYAFNRRAVGRDGQVFMPGMTLRPG